MFTEIPFITAIPKLESSNSCQFIVSQESINACYPQALQAKLKNFFANNENEMFVQADMQENKFYCITSSTAKIQDVIEKIATISSYQSEQNQYFLDVDSFGSESNLSQAIIKLDACLFQHQVYKQDNKAKTFSLSLLSQKQDASLEASILDSLGQVRAIRRAKDLAFMPPNLLTPESFGDKAEEFAVAHELQITRIKEPDFVKNNLHAIHAVSKGSELDGELVMLEYFGREGKEAVKEVDLALVGKGVIFDTGGISLKPGAKMDEMKYDMCGAASAFAAFTFAVEQKLKVNLVLSLGLVENMPDGKAYKPGDVIKSYSGKTIEVLNTDAEGRIVLCDALAYTQKNYTILRILDLATLTGAAIVALGHHYGAFYSSHQSFTNEITKASILANELQWNMPLDEKYHEQLKSDIADVANVGGMQGGSVTAACFLQKFVDKDIPWAHFDIAGIAWGPKRFPSGRPVRMLCELLKLIAQ